MLTESTDHELTIARIIHRNPLAIRGTYNLLKTREVVQLLRNWCEELKIPPNSHGFGDEAIGAARSIKVSRTFSPESKDRP